MDRGRKPSLAKARPPALVERDGHFIRTTEGRWRELFAKADAISEGAVKDEHGERVWYGSTSLILGLPVDTPVEERAFLKALAQKDVHVHVHALRCAHREAQSRAPAMLGRLVCEVTFHVDRRGLRIDVDVQAPLIERRSAARSGP
ncbi:hypothetical protein [Labilithrix luteola]|uniref:hypothetical protein n=1 Tax=Labilithrix luteola TaxID=1391654 RepID=UPI0011BABED4|nr:hypothetical protein [Labilithrix luteola]